MEPQRISISAYYSGVSHLDARAAFERVCDGRVQSPGERPGMEFDPEAYTAWICRLAAQGRVVAALAEQEGGRYATHLSLIEHPSLSRGEVYAVRHSQGAGYGNVYRCTPEDARMALAFSGAYNL